MADLWSPSNGSNTIVLSADIGFVMQWTFHKTSRTWSVYSSIDYGTKNTKEKQSVFLRDEAVISQLMSLNEAWNLEWKKIIITVTLIK